MAGVFRVICCNGLVVGDLAQDIRVSHQGRVDHDVIEGAWRMRETFEDVQQRIEAMKALLLAPSEQLAFATAALALRFGHSAVASTGGHTPAPVTAQQLNQERRWEDVGHDLWRTLQRISEHVLRGGQPGRSAQGRRLLIRPVTSIHRSVSLNRALWTLAEEMLQIKAEH